MKTPQRVQSTDDIIENIKTVESYLNEYSNEEDFLEMAEYIKKGRNLLCYKYNGEYHFVPSRFIGYKKNTLSKHYRNRTDSKITAIGDDGTSTLLNKQFGKCKPDDNLDNQFKRYCESLGQEEENRKRTFWVLPSELNEKLNKGEFIEGDTRLVTHKRYERNRQARDKCIEIKGTTCYTCEINLVDVYGEIAKDYIQVHHIIPIALRKKSYKVDPEKKSNTCLS